MDPASLTLGLAPIVGGMVKTYIVVYRKLRVFRHADREVDRISRQLDRQQQVFTNEIRLLLRDILDNEDIIAAMVVDGDHEGWKSPELNDGLKSFLGGSYESFTGIMDDIHEYMDYLLNELRSFDKLLEDEQKTVPGRREKMRETMQQMGSAAKLAFDKTKCDGAIQCLRTANGDMRSLRQQVLELQPKKPGVDNTCLPDFVQKLRPGYACCSKIRRAARALHQALSDNLTGRSHDVRLFLQATVAGDNTVTDLALVCPGEESSVQNIVQVRSCPIQWLPTPSPSPESSMERLRLAEAPIKRRKVQFQDQQPEAHLSPEPIRPGQRQQSNSNPTQNLCLEVCGGTTCLGKGKGHGCLCYVETNADEAFRHEFYPGDGRYQGTTEVATFDNILNLPVETAINVVDQLKLARTIVSAVLYFSCTPWLAEYWGVKDLFFFHDNNGDLSTSLRTVNLRATFSGKEPSPRPTTMMEGIITPPLDQHRKARLKHGIRNVALHNLGAVLLQIGRWKRVDNSDDLVGVRDLAEQSSRLGAKYQDLIQKCLYCNFRGGINLSRPQLQQAVYEDVVEELDAMIKRLDLSVDEGP